jgi:streptogramin lyase
MVRGLFDFGLFRGIGRRRPQSARHRPALEALEDRRLLSTFNEFPLPDLPRPHFGTDLILLDGITAGPDGNVWFTDTDARAIGSITPSGSFSEFVQDHTFPNVYFVQGIATGADGNLWFGGLLDANGPRIGQVTPDGTVTRFSIPFLDVPGTDEQEQNIRGLTAGPDGNVWYNEFVYPGFGAIGRVTPDGQATVLYLSPTPNDFGTGGITTGPDGNVWFITGARSELGRITSGWPNHPISARPVRSVHPQGDDHGRPRRQPLGHRRPSGHSHRP